MAKKYLEKQRKCLRFQQRGKQLRGAGRRLVCYWYYQTVPRETELRKNLELFHLCVIVNDSKGNIIEQSMWWMLLQNLLVHVALYDFAPCLTECWCFSLQNEAKQTLQLHNHKGLNMRNPFNALIACASVLLIKFACDLKRKACVKLSVNVALELAQKLKK